MRICSSGLGRTTGLALEALPAAAGAPAVPSAKTSAVMVMCGLRRILVCLLGLPVAVCDRIGGNRAGGRSRCGWRRLEFGKSPVGSGFSGRGCWVVALPAGDRLLEFRILGPLEVVDGDRPLALGGPKQRAGPPPVPWTR